MYRFGERIHHHRKLYVWLISFVCVLVISVFAGDKLLKSDTHIAKAPAPTVHALNYNDTKTITFSEPLFMIALPSDWKLESKATTPYVTYRFGSTLAHQDARWLDIYTDGVPAGFGVNRALAVSASGGKLVLESDVSDNCANFTGPVAGQPATATLGKWQGVDFLCDLGNYVRDVVGTSSPEGPDVVTLTGTTGKHQFFFAYTDNNASADYSIFTNALKTFRAK
jgi:hypothetical protein